MKFNLFSYGSNMDLAQLEIERGIQTCGKPMLGILPHHELRFNLKSKSRPGFGGANINPADGRYVAGVVTTVSDEGLAALEDIESQYRRTTLDVFLPKRNVWLLVVTYQAKTHNLDEGLKPHPEYFDRVHRGAQRFLPESYVSRLETFRPMAQGEQTLSRRERY
jgi:hypothetical protein